MTVKERPILFSAPMVRAILDGRKTQTRRVVKLQPSTNADIGYNGFGIPFIRNPDPLRPNLSCPYGTPGDRLYVRETWGCKAADRPGVPEGRKPLPGDQIQYQANDADAWQWREPGSLPWRPSIHMPRWASRILLEVTDVRVERLQAISEDDAVAEGMEPVRTARALANESRPPPASTQFADLWKSINGPGSLDKNPWVWAIAFRRIVP